VPEPAAAATRGAILVVDDNPSSRYATSHILRADGFLVFEAASGQEALLLAEQRRPDLVVLDVNLPDIDGFEVCRRLRASPLTARTPVVHLSATFVNAADQVRGFEMGADGYITHPVEPPVLIATVNAFLRTRRAEDAMRASEAKFKAVFEQAPSGIALFDSDMTFLDVNPATCATFSRDAEALIGQPLSGLLPAGSRGALEDIDRELAGTGVWRGVFPVVRADGRLVPIEWILSQHSVPGTRLAMMTDISERRAVEADRERLLDSEQAARADAERASRLKDDFLAALSHELRTPLNAIVGWAELLRRRIDPRDTEMFKGVQAIARNARVQTQLIADLLDISRITSGKLNLDLTWFDPREAIEASVSALAGVAQARDVTIQSEIESTGELYWDQARFQQVIWNLLDNAVKFSKRGGAVVIRLVNTGDGFELSVSDQGRGIAADFLPFIFERFRQEDASTRRQHGGLGLGLAIVKELVEAHGGTVSASSGGVDGGATFTVRLKRSEAPTPVTVAVETVSAANLQGVRVLVVEDDDDSRALIARMLTQAQADVCDVADVPAAVGVLDTFKPDLVVSDIGIPGEDGYDLIRQIRSRGLDATRLPAIALTAYARSEDRVRALEAGYQRHLVKPVDFTQLIRAATLLTHQLASRGRE
jgi:PAS domain S-box-containing protein